MEDFYEFIYDRIVNSCVYGVANLSFNTHVWHIKALKVKAHLLKSDFINQEKNLILRHFSHSSSSDIYI